MVAVAGGGGGNRGDGNRGGGGVSCGGHGGGGRFDAKKFFQVTLFTRIMLVLITMFSKAKKVGKARRNLGMRKNLRNTIRILEHWNINAWNEKKNSVKRTQEWGM